LRAKNLPTKTKNPLGLLAGGLKSVWFSELLSTPQRARRMAVVMMAMGVVYRLHEIERIGDTEMCVNQKIEWVKY